MMALSRCLSNDSILRGVTSLSPAPVSCEVTMQVGTLPLAKVSQLVLPNPPRLFARAVPERRGCSSLLPSDRFPRLRYS